MARWVCPEAVDGLMRIGGFAVAPNQAPTVTLPADRIAELDPKKETVVICRSGGRSAQVAEFLERQGFRKVFNLSGGILAWSRVIDPRIPQY